MTDKQEESLEKVMPWLNRLMLGMITYFAMQFNTTVSNISEKLDLVVTNQAVYALQINANKDNIKEVFRILEKMQNEQMEHYKQYNYLYSEQAKKKLSQNK